MVHARYSHTEAGELGHPSVSVQVVNLGLLMVLLPNLVFREIRTLASFRLTVVWVGVGYRFGLIGRFGRNVLRKKIMEKFGREIGVLPLKSGISG